MDREDLRKLAGRRAGDAPEDRLSGRDLELEGARRSGDPRLDVEVLQSVMEGDDDPGDRDASRERLRALRSWRDALLRRHVLTSRRAEGAAPPRLDLSVPAPGPLASAERVADRVGAPTRAALDLAGLARAGNHAAVDDFLPDFAHYGPIRRFLARAVARGTRYVARFVLSRQRVVNSILVEYAAEGVDRLNEQQERIDRLIAGVQDVVDRQRDDAAQRLDELRQASGALRANVEELGSGLDETVRTSREHDVRLTDAECDVAWSRVAEVDHREQLERLERLQRGLGNRLGAQARRLESLRRQAEKHVELSEELARVRERQRDLERGLAALGEKHESLPPRIEELARELRERGASVSSHQRALAELAELAPRVEEIEEGLAGLDRAYEEIASAEEHRRADEPAGHLGSALDGLYVNLENQFRGPRELVKSRLESYLPLLAETGAGAVEQPILDVGCGRGEWLELLSERGLLARGVEINNVAVSNCRSLGLDVTAGDALDYLQEQGANGLGMVTAFHVLEHLPFEYIVDLLGETLRVLQPGGVALFETPNAENLVVSARNFYTDPTHRQPLLPDLLVFLLQQHGFLRVRVERQTAARPDESLEELDASDPLAERLNPLIGLLNRHFAAPSDFAVLGYKPR